MKPNGRGMSIAVMLLLLLTITHFLNFQAYWALVLIAVAVVAVPLVRKSMYAVPMAQLVVLCITFGMYFLIYQSMHEVAHYQYVIYLIGPPGFYYCGMVMMKYEKNNRATFFENCLLVIALGGTLYALACACYKVLNYSTYAQLLVSNRIPTSMYSRYGLEIWTNTLFQPTNLNSYCLVAIVSLFPARRFVENKWKRRMFYVAGGIGILICFLTASRTNLLFLLISWFVVTVLCSRGKKKLRTMRVKRNSIYLAVVGMVCLLMLSQKLITVAQNSALGNRLVKENLSFATDGRWVRMARVFTHLLDYPFGGMPYTMAHNLWLDVARVTGLLPMAFMIAFTIGTLLSVGRMVVRNKRNDLGIWMASVIVTMFGAFMFEPVIEGRPYIFMVYCLFAGMAKVTEKAMCSSIQRRRMLNQ